MPCAFLCTANATNNIKERTRHSFSTAVKATVIFIPLTDDYYAFAFCLLSLTGYVYFPWENFTNRYFRSIKFDILLSLFPCCIFFVHDGNIFV